MKWLSLSMDSQKINVTLTHRQSIENLHIESGKKRKQYVTLHSDIWQTSKGMADGPWNINRSKYPVLGSRKVSHCSRLEHLHVCSSHSGFIYLSLFFAIR
jgi:hypothetical protein